MDDPRRVDQGARGRDARGAERQHAARRQLQHPRSPPPVARRAAEAPAQPSRAARRDPLSHVLLPRRVGLLPDRRPAPDARPGRVRSTNRRRPAAGCRRGRRDRRPGQRPWRGALLDVLLSPLDGQQRAVGTGPRGAARTARRRTTTAATHVPLRLRPRDDRFTGLPVAPWHAPARASRRRLCRDVRGRPRTVHVQALPARGLARRPGRRARARASRRRCPRPRLLPCRQRRAPVLLPRIRPAGGLAHALHVRHLSRVPHVAGRPGLITAEALGESLAAYCRLVETLEANETLVGTVLYGEPQLSRRGLYPTTGGGPDARAQRELQDMLQLLSRCDASVDLLEIAAAIGRPAWDLRAAADTLRKHDLLRVAARAQSGRHRDAGAG